MTKEQRAKDNCRSYAGVYLRRGKIERGACEIDGCLSPAEMHHDDYADPLRVRWFCRSHHVAFHRRARALQALEDLAVFVQFVRHR
jgi:hypothetical protein